MNIDAQIRTVFDTSKKMALNKPDYLFITFSKKDKKTNSTIFKVYNNDKVPFFSLITTNKKLLAHSLKEFLSTEKIPFRFETTTDSKILNIETEIRRLFFKDWLIKTKNIYQHHPISMQMALKKIK
jgi:hypothetical protein